MGKDAKILTAIGVLTIAIVLIAAFTIGNKPTQQQKTLADTEKKILLNNHTHLIKSPNAKVTIVEFGDFQCPACGAAYSQVKRIKDDYKGKINFAFREFPLNVHPNAYTAALATEAAGSQGKFWEMHDKLYENQNEWSEKKDPLDTFAKYAKDIGINIDKFKSDIKNKTYDKWIQTDINDGNRLGISATPTFYINGEEHAGVLLYDDFKVKIERELKK